MKIAMGCDHGGYELKEALKKSIEKMGHEVEDFGCYSSESCDYPDFGAAAARAVADGRCEKGVVVCTTGIGISIAANKIRGIRCAHCADSLEAELTLQPGDGEVIRGRMRELMEKRKTSQPLDLPSAGSTFKRPAGGYAAAMIDEAGLKGYAVGGAQVSPKHAGFVVNTGGATFEDVRRLMEHIQNEVYRRFGVMLEPEVKIIEG